MRRREFLKVGLSLAALPLLGSLLDEPTSDDMGVPRAWEELIARAEARDREAECFHSEEQHVHFLLGENPGGVSGHRAGRPTPTAV